MRGIPEPGTVDVQRKVVGVRQLADGIDIVRGEHAAATAIVGVFQRNQACGRVVFVVAADGFGDPVEVDGPVGLVGQNMGVDAADR